MAPRKPALNPSFNHYLAGLRGDQPLELVLVGHLVIEALLVEVLQLRELGEEHWRTKFRTKVRRAVEFGLLQADRVAVYERLNDIRNDFAHILGHRVSYDQLFDLARLMAGLGYDFSDDTVHQDRERSEEWYGFEGVLIEILNQLYLELAWILHDNGGPDRLGG